MPGHAWKRTGPIDNSIEYQQMQVTVTHVIDRESDNKCTPYPGDVKFLR